MLTQLTFCSRACAYLKPCLFIILLYVIESRRLKIKPSLTFALSPHTLYFLSIVLFLDLCNRRSATWSICHNKHTLDVN